MSKSNLVPNIECLVEKCKTGSRVLNIRVGERKNDRPKVAKEIEDKLIAN